MSPIPITIFFLAIAFAVAGLFVKGTQFEWESFSTNLAELIADIGVPAVAYAVPGAKVGRGGTPDTAKVILKLLRPLMQALLSIAFAAAGFWIVFSHAFSAQEKHWGYTTLGTILGYWLKH